jgi:hypothetical protein
MKRKSGKNKHATYVLCYTTILRIRERVSTERGYAAEMSFLRTFKGYGRGVKLRIENIGTQLLVLSSLTLRKKHILRVDTLVIGGVVCERSIGKRVEGSLPRAINRKGGRAIAQAVSSRRRPGFAPRLFHWGYVGDKVALGQSFLRVIRFSPISIIPSLLHIHSCIIWGMDNGLDRGSAPQRHSLISSQQQ